MLRDRAILVLVLTILVAAPAHADSVVTVCNTDRGGGGTNLATAIQAGGLVTFNCPGEATIRMSATHRVTRAVRIDGGGRVTLLEGNEPMFAAADAAASLELKNLKFRDTKRPIVQQNPNASSALTVSGSTFTNCEAPFRAQNGPMTIRESVFTNNTGHVVAAVDVLTIERSRFVGTKGIAVFAQTPDQATRIIDSEFTDNSSGALLVGAGSSTNFNQTLEILRSTFTNNGRDEKNPTGGAVFGALAMSCNTSAPNCTVKIQSSKFVGNQADQGGAIRISGAALVSLQNVRFEGNVAKQEGGGIYFDPASAPQPKIELKHAVFRGNRANQGGAIRIAVARLEGTAVSFFKNEAKQNGGALYTSDTTQFSAGASSGSVTPVHISRGVFADNVAGDVGSAAWVFGGAPSEFANTLIVRNRGPNGAIAAENLRFVNSTIKDNEGHGIRMTLGSGSRRIVLRNTIVASNGKQNCALFMGARLETAQTGAPITADLLDEGNNLEFPAASCATTIPVADPHLDTLYLPVFGSPAMGQGDNKTCLDSPVSARDVYGKRRPQGLACSIGAAEGDLEKEIADRTIGGPAWPGRLDRDGSRPPDATGTGPRPPKTDTGTCCCCCPTCGR